MRGSTGRQVVAAAAVLVTVGIVFAAVAFGDQLRNNAVSSSASGIGGNLQVTLGDDGLGRVTVGYWVEDLGGDGCSVSEATPGNVVINLLEGVTASPDIFSLDNCVSRRGTGRQNVVFCVDRPGTFEVPNATVTSGSSQTLTSQTTAFKITAEGTPVVGASCSGDGGTDPDEVNSPPEVDLGAGDVSEDEGSPMAMNGSFKDADGDTLTLTAEDGAGNGIGADDGFIDNGDGTWDWSDTKFDDYSGKVFVSADDGNGGAALDSFDWESTNVDPAIAGATVSGSACRPTVTFDIGDPGTEDDWAHVVSFDGQPAVDLLATIPAWVTGASPDPYSGANSGLTATKSSVYSSTGTKSITIAAKDDNGGEGSTSTAHEVPNTVAAARFGPPVQIDGNGKGLFKAGSTIPVKVRAAACAFESNGTYTPVSGANLKVLTLTYLGPDLNGVPVTATSNVKANTDGWMRPSENQYIYNLATPRTAKGTYLLKVEGFEDRLSGTPTGFSVSKQIVIR